MSESPTTTTVLRAHAEDANSAELTALAVVDDRPRPPRWRLSPWAVTTYLLGGTLDDGTEITPKYLGSRRLMEVAVASLATDRALLLLGIPGTAKTWVSEHLAAARSARGEHRLGPGSLHGGDDRGSPSSAGVGGKALVLCVVDDRDTLVAQLSDCVRADGGVDRADQQCVEGCGLEMSGQVTGEGERLE